MNQRIQELTEQSGAGWDDKYHWYVSKAQMEKFAELIVRECANIVWDEAEKTMSSEVNDAGYKIIEYFGVEE